MRVAGSPGIQKRGISEKPRFFYGIGFSVFPRFAVFDKIRGPVYDCWEIFRQNDTLGRYDNSPAGNSGVSVCYAAIGIPAGF